MRNPSKKQRKAIGKPEEKHRKNIRKPKENQRKENPRKSIGKPWGNQRKDEGRAEGTPMGRSVRGMPQGQLLYLSKSELQ